MSEVKFKECPFCGHKIIEIVFLYGYRGECTKCFAKGPCSDLKEEAIKLWNTRYKKLDKCNCSKCTGLPDIEKYYPPDSDEELEAIYDENYTTNEPD